MLFCLILQGASANGIPVHQDLHIYTSWCPIQGSHLANAPNPDAIIRNILDDVNTNIYTGQAGIVFESALDFPVTYRTTSPILDDIEVRTIGIEQQGDIYRSPFNEETSDQIDICNSVWGQNSEGDPIPINGIIVLSLNLYLNVSGLIYKTDGSQVIGESFCEKVFPDPNCVVPYNAYATVIDNYYTFNGIGDLHLDILNQNPAHELGHTLSSNDLSSPPENLMYWKQVPNSSGIVDNTEIVLEQKNRFRYNGENIGGSYMMLTIPVTKIVPVNPWIRFVIADNLYESIPYPKADLRSLGLAINTNTSGVNFDIKPKGILSLNDTNNVDYGYWLLIDRGNDLASKNLTNFINYTFGSNNLTTILDKVGQKAINLYTKTNINTNESIFNGTLWTTKGNGSSVTLVPSNISNVSLTYLTSNSHLNSSNTSPANNFGEPISSFIKVQLDNSSNIDPLNPFTIQAMSTFKGKIIDVINPKMINITEFLPSNLIQRFNQTHSNITTN